MAFNFLGMTFGKKSEELPSMIQTKPMDGNFAFTTPFLPVGQGNLALPYITPQYTSSGYVRWGTDNLYGNLLRQLYHTSPLQSSIVNFINNATVGGGYELEGVQKTAKDKIEIYKFENSIGLKKFLPRITQDALIFGAINLLIENDSKGQVKSIKRIPMDELRWTENVSCYYHSKDFSRSSVGVKYEPYQIDKPNHKGILTFRFDDGDAIYPMPSYASANNWIFLDGESSYLHKSNILNSIYPSVIFKFPKKPASQEELFSYRDTLESVKGAGNAGKAIAFFENGIEMLPSIETIPAGDNDKLFLQTDERTDSKIAQAWSIDPILLGIRVSGKLGSGTDIKQAYIIFEKNVIMPLRNEIEDIMNFLLQISKLNAKFSLKNFQIIGEVIAEVKN